VRPWSATITPPTLDGRTLDAFCELLAQLNVWYLEDTPGCPDLYASGVRYASDAQAIAGGPEDWPAIPWLIFRWNRWGIGADCKKLASWRVAELRVRDRERGARCVHESRWEGGRVLYHVLVQRADGSREDPSVALGMREYLARNPIPALVSGARPWFL
jgi:hypothetical protein